MIALIQRVLRASVTVDGATVGSIGPGILAFVGVEKGDTVRQADRLVQRVLGYRIFEDEAARMNLSVADTGGGLLLVPQFTLAADTRKGMRPSFTPAAQPEAGRALFGEVLAAARSAHRDVAAGRFGAHMEVALVNDGPVTFWLRAAPVAADTVFGV